MLVCVITAYVTKGSGADGTPGNSEADATAARATGSELTTPGVPGARRGLVYRNISPPVDVHAPQG